MRNIPILIVLAILTVLISGCAQKEYSPVINANEFSTEIDNPYFTLVPGATFVYEAETEEGTERTVVTVASDIKVVMGVTVTVVTDEVFLDGKLIEYTKDWYAQDADGNVWYFGEESKEMVNGVVVSTEGSWEAGVNGAQPGMVMKAQPKIGDTYRQEFLKGEAEDMADVLALGESVTVPYGSFTGCIKTRDYTPLEPGADEHKYYCPEVNFVVLEVGVEDGQRTELINITKTQVTIIKEPETPILETNITEDEAKAIALEEVPGTVTDIAIEEKFGKATYVVEVVRASDSAEVDVIIDIETGEVLAVEA